MLIKALKKKLLEHITERVQNFEYGDLDVFFEDEELDETQIEECFDYIRKLKVVEDAKA